MPSLKIVSIAVGFLAWLPSSASANCAFAQQQAFWKDGKATCSVTVTNNCPRPITCDIVMRGTGADGRVVSDRKSNIAVAPGDEISAGLTDVRSCGNWRWSCR